MDWQQRKGKAREWIGSSARAARRPPICRNRRPAAGQLCCPGQGKGMDWRRSTLLLPLPAGGRLTANSAQGNGLARAAYRRRSLPWARAARRRSILLPIAAGQLCFCRPPFFAGGQCCPGQGNGLAAAARRPPICRNRRPAAVTLLPWARQGGGGQSCCPGQWIGSGGQSW